MPRQDIAPCPGGLRQAPEIRPPQGLAPVTDVFPAGVRLHLLETGIQVIRLSPCHADLPVHHPRHLGTATGFLPCYFPLMSFRTPVRHQIQRYLLSSLPAVRAIQQCASWRTLGSNRPPTRAPAHYVPVPDGTDPQEPEFRAAAFSFYHWLSGYTPAGPGKAHASRYWRARAPPSRPWPGWSARPARRFPRSGGPRCAASPAAR